MPPLTLPVRLQFANAEFAIYFTIMDFEFMMEPNDSYNISFDLPGSDQYYTLAVDEVIQIDPGGACWVFLEVVIHEDPEETNNLVDKFKQLYGDRIADVETKALILDAVDHDEPSASPAPQK